ncbi:hypothetical protein CJ030_MR6G019885 [Morella rubra]|uniref:Uncharacterized protein n=1 Tax=Morella rubra TaxID=262757 RepID=A0A6A1VD85_9ROSI|nr:hypothetical protein CJ030_MR6G019885 [Morella rubra]
MDSRLPALRNGPWTNEKHVHFLNTMEASFVRAMFDGNSRILRLDRNLPDSSESTLDLKVQRRGKHGIPVSDTANIGTGDRMDGRAEKRTRRGLSRPWNPSQDQVVPQLESNSGGAKDEIGLPNVATAHVS